MFQVHADWMRIATRTEPREFPIHSPRTGNTPANIARRPKFRWLRWRKGRKSAS